MDKETNDEVWRQKIESQLFQIKVMLLILIDLFILGFYGLARAGWDDISMPMTKIAVVFMVAVFLLSGVIVIVWAEARKSTAKNKKDETIQIEEKKSQNKT